MPDPQENGGVPASTIGIMVALGFMVLLAWGGGHDRTSAMAPDSNISLLR